MTLRSLSTILALAMTTTMLACVEKDADGEETGSEETDQPTLEICDNEADDDEDGAIDCDDSDCVDDAACVTAEDEVCDDGVDNDGDGTVDCDDTDCAADEACAAPATELDCDNAADDDADGATDCDDSDCAGDAACATTDVEVACVDGLDNDADGLSDCADTDCAADPSCLPPEPEIACVDGADNDADGLIDCADPDCVADPSCESVEIEVACVDGVDNDADGRIDCDDTDCAADPDCAGASVELLCADGADNDADGLVDCDDSDCEASADCGISLGEIDCADGVDNDVDGLVDCDDFDCSFSPDCAAALPELCSDGIDDDLDGAIDCDDSDCAADAACAAPSTCGTDGDLGSAIGPALASGTTIGGGDDFAVSCTSSTAEDLSFVWTAPADGNYTITTNGSAYDTVLTLWSEDCSVGETCDDDDGDSTQSLEVISAVAGDEVVIVVDGYSINAGDYVLSVYSEFETSCRDGVDEDGDGGADCADTDCAADATCIPEPVCEDGLDDDIDGFTDCDDSDCADLLLCTHPCADDELGSPVGAAIATGTTLGAGDDYTSECSYYDSEDVAWLWTAPADGVYTFDTIGTSFDTILSVEQGDCSGTEIGCDDDTTGLLSEVSVALFAGEEVVVQVEGYDDVEAGDYTLNVWSDSEVDCTDGGDDDVDGATDCADVDCTGADACVPEAFCADAADDDIDGNQDCLDSDCAADAACDGSLADYDLGSVTGTAIATGSTVGMGNEWSVSCTSSTAPDVSYAWVAPSTRVWTFDLSGSAYDTVLTVWTETATGIECDDDDGTDSDSLISRSVNAGDLVILAVDGYSSSSGSYTLAIY